MSVRRTHADSWFARRTCGAPSGVSREAVIVVMVRAQAARRRVHHCSRLMASSSVNEISSITTASAVAPA